MAVVFISPKGRQKMFFMGITAVFIVFVVAVAFIVFLSQPKQEELQIIFNRPKVNIDFKILDSEEFKKLEPFTEMELQFAYDAKTKEGEAAKGFIAAVSREEALKILESIELTAINIEEVKIGRDNPFTPYSQTLISK